MHATHKNMTARRHAQQRRSDHAKERRLAHAKFASDLKADAFEMMRRQGQTLLEIPEDFFFDMEALR